jgi:hypothetical protein
MRETLLVRPREETIENGYNKHRAILHHRVDILSSLDITSSVALILC